MSKKLESNKTQQNFQIGNKKSVFEQTSGNISTAYLIYIIKKYLQSVHQTMTDVTVSNNMPHWTGNICCISP